MLFSLFVRTLESTLHILYYRSRQVDPKKSKYSDYLQIIILMPIRTIPRLHIMMDFRYQFGIRLRFILLTVVLILEEI
jgi:hypothetical protein